MYSIQGVYINEHFSNTDIYSKYSSLYDNLRNEWGSIFPDTNRNSGGVQFFNHLMKMDLPKEEFDIYNKFYCGVSGSLIDPERILTKKNDSWEFKQSNSANKFVMVKDKDDKFHCGFYYLCCWPCGADIMNYDNVNVLLEKVDLKLKDGTFKYHVLTIPDPCKKSITKNGNEVLPDPKNKTEPWNDVSSFQCKNKLTENAYRTDSGRIVFAILHDVSSCNLESYQSNPNFDKEFYEKVVSRNGGSELQQWGMGQIFVELSNL